MRHHLTSIVAIDTHGAIGCKNHLPWTIKSDLAFFRRTTLGHSIIMGRKTYDSVGGGLKGRTNLVLSHNTVLFKSNETCKHVGSVCEALATIRRDENAFVVGGAATYIEFSRYVDRYLVTVVEHEAADADAFLSADILRDLKNWSVSEIGKFPAVSGKDEFPFTILEFLAPDAEMRRLRRDRIVGEYLEKIPNQRVRKRSGPRHLNEIEQSTFAF